MRYGTLLLAHSINAFSLLSSPLVILSFELLFRGSYRLIVYFRLDCEAGNVVNAGKELSCIISIVCLFAPENWKCQCCFPFEGESFGAAIWQIPEPYGQSNSSTLECVASLDAHVGKINWWVHGVYNFSSLEVVEIFLSLFPLRLFLFSCGNSVLWCPSGKSDKLVSLDEQNLVLWSLDCSKKSAEVIWALRMERKIPLNNFSTTFEVLSA